jgi:hypothetical protein
MKMAEQISTLTRHDLEAKIVKRCWEDEEFRRDFTADPVGTAAKHLAVSAANLPKIAIHEEPAGSWHIVLPSRPAAADQLSEEDLERVAGGISPIYASVVATAAAAATALTAVASISGAITPDKGW